MILDAIVRAKRVDLTEVQRRVSISELQRRACYRDPRRDFRAALVGKPRAIIAEVKRASPSKGVIRADFDPVRIATAYAANGAAAVSVLTEEHYFQGQLDYLAAIRSAVGVPLLRKDFLFDAYQLYEARAFGADAVLLIVAILDDGHLHDLLQLADELDLAALVEVHDRAEIDRALRSGRRLRLLGINNRDLRTFRTALETTEVLAPVVPPDILVIAESGIESGTDMDRLERAGVTAFLIGETLMRAPDPGVHLAKLLKTRAAHR